MIKHPKQHPQPPQAHGFCQKDFDSVRPMTSFYIVAAPPVSGSATSLLI
ncbi:MAG: hypothetical protein K0U98_13855 [Deltaproteobacteria bacterium]|nr:hypothetical protein [Deltaproteobacteria bacterium]